VPPTAPSLVELQVLATAAASLAANGGLGVVATDDLLLQLERQRSVLSQCSGQGSTRAVAVVLASSTAVQRRSSGGGGAGVGAW
jgi:hypothetical protein